MKAAHNLQSKVVDKVITFSKLDSNDETETLLETENKAGVNDENKIGVPKLADAGGA